MDHASALSHDGGKGAHTRGRKTALASTSDCGSVITIAVSSRFHLDAINRPRRDVLKRGRSRKLLKTVGSREMANPRDATAGAGAATGEHQACQAITRRCLLHGSGFYGMDSLGRSRSSTVWIPHALCRADLPAAQHETVHNRRATHLYPLEDARSYRLSSGGGTADDEFSGGRRHGDAVEY